MESLKCETDKVNASLTDHPGNKGKGGLKMGQKICSGLPTKSGKKVHTRNVNIPDAETEGWQVQGQP